MSTILPDAGARPLNRLVDQSRLLLRATVTALVFSGFMPVSSAYCAEPSAAALIEALLSGREPIGGPFDLIDHTGQRRTDRDFRGKLILIYFGYTHCPDVCPTELLAISLALEKLGSAGDTVQPLFITVDPERDTPSVLADYLSSFHPRLVGLTGDPSAIRQVALAYKTFFARADVDRADDYAVDHTGFIYVVGRDGRYLGFLPPQLPPDQIVDAIRPHLEARGNNPTQ
jgi:protein SCO1/2